MNRLSNFSLAVLLTVTLSLTGCGRKDEPKSKEPAAEDASDVSSKDNVKQKVLSFNLEGLSDKGAKKWDVTGESAEAITENQVKLDNITAKTYGEDGQATITAKKGMYDKTQSNVRLQDDVKATIENTEALAGGLVNLPVGTAGKDAAGQEAAKDKKKKTTTVITCDGDALFNYEKNEASFSKNVKVVSDDGNIDADKITAYMDPATKKLKNIVAEGSVKIVHGENTAYSQKASYTEAEKKVVLSGQPKVIIEREGGIEADLAGEK